MGWWWLERKKKVDQLHYWPKDKSMTDMTTYSYSVSSIVPEPSEKTRILILGATGFIGRNMVERFAAQGDKYEVLATWHERPAYPSDGDNVKWIYADLRDYAQVKKALSDVDIIIQAAATTSGARDIVNTPAVHVTDNAVMNSLIFRAAADAGVKHVVFFSCTTMFTTGCVTEETPIDVPEKYFGVAHTKMYLEKMAEFYAKVSKDTKFTVIRHSNCYGPHDKYDTEKSHVMGATIGKVMGIPELKIGNEMAAYEVAQRVEEQKVVVWGTGEETRDLLYVDDLVDFVELALEKQPTKFGLYNVGSGAAISVRELVEKVIALSGKSGLRIEHDLTKPTIPTSLWLDCGKAQRAPGWRPKVTLDEGIKRAIVWYRENYMGMESHTHAS